jgi:hypothetical protein
MVLQKKLLKEPPERPLMKLPMEMEKTLPRKLEMNGLLLVSCASHYYELRPIRDITKPAQFHSRSASRCGRVSTSSRSGCLQE